MKDRTKRPKDKDQPGTKDSVTRAPEAGETRDRDARRGTPVSANTDDVRNAPESGDKTQDPTA